MPLTFVPQHRQQDFVDYSTPTDAVSLFADSEGGLATLARIAELAGADVLTTARCDARALAGARLGRVVLVDLTGEPDDRQDAFLTLVDARAEDSGARLVVACAPESIDLVFARTEAQRTDILANASDAERQLALAQALAARPANVFAELNGEEGLRIQRLADEVGRIAKSLADLADGETGRRDTLSDGLVGYRSGPFLPNEDAGGIDAEDIRAVIRLRRLRDRFFQAELFADPAWDMLLDLMAARLDRTKVSVSSLCIAAAVPPTTALRWIKTMTDRGLFKRIQDPHDARRVFIELSDEAAAGMQSFFLAAKATGGLAV